VKAAFSLFDVAERIDLANVVLVLAGVMT